MGKTIQEALLPIFDLPAVYKKGGKEAVQEYIRATTADLQIEKAKREENKLNQRDAQQKAAEYARNGANQQGQKASTDASAAAEAARKLYDTYVGSDDHQKALEEAGKVDPKQALLNALSMPFADAPVTKKDIPQDETEKSLRAMKDYYESQEVQAENDAVMKRNLEEIAAMPEEDRNNLNRYIIERAQNRTNRFLSGEMQFDTYNMNPIISKYGDKKVREYAEALEWSQNADLMQQVESAGEEIGDKHPVLGSAASVGANVLGASAGIIGRAQELENRTGQFKTLDPNNIGSAPAAFGGAVRGQVTQNIKGDGNSWLRNLAAIAYQGGMSFADSTARLAASGGSSAISAAMASSGAFSESVRKYSQNGATPEQAAAMAFVDAGLEYVTEKLPTDKVLELFKGGTKKEVVARILAQTFLVEPSSEEVNLFSSVAAQAAILGEKSDKNLRIGELIANGMSYKDAEAQYQRELWQEAAETYAVSAIAGGMSGVGAAAIGQSRQRRGQNPTAQSGAADVQADVQTDVQSAQVAPEQQNVPDFVAQTGEQAAAMAPQVQQDTMTEGMQNLNAGMEALMDWTKGRGENGATNKMALELLSDPEAMQRITEITGKEITGVTASEKRRSAKEALNTLFDMVKTKEVSPEAAAENNFAAGQNGVDIGEAVAYNNSNNDPGGMNNAGTEYQNGQQNDGAGSTGNPAAGLAGVQQSNGSDNQGRGQFGGLAGDAGVLRVSDKLQEAQRKRGTQTYPVRDTTGNPESYEQALIAGRNSDPKNGWCVTPKSAQELRDGNVRTFMNESGTVGVGVAPDGDIVAVFKNQNGGPRKALDTLMPIAIEQGGDRLDCYGEGLVKAYASYGFTPVARVEFNQEYANEGWTPEKGTPYIYVMMHNGDSADKVAANMGNYNIPSKDQLDALPTYGKDDYDSAMAYRDSLMQKRGTQNSESDTGTVGMQSGDSGDIRKSNAITNSGLHSADADIKAGVKQALKNDPEIGDYSVKHNADTLATAQERTATPERVQAEFGYLLQKNPAAFTPEDVVTGQLVSKELFKAGDADGFAAMEGQLAEAAHRYGQGSQAFAIIGTMKDAADPQTAAKKAAETIMGMKQEQSTYTGKDGRSYQQWQKDISREMTSIGMQIEAVPDGNVNAMIDVITQLARRRKTTAWFGSSENLTGKARAILKRLSFEDLKKIANTQLAAMPDDFRRRTAGEIAGGLRKQHMLSSIKTILRNLSGNTAAGSMDAISDSTGGRMIDALLSRVTGKRTMGNDMAQLGKYAQGAVDGAVWASLCVELNIPIETDIDASYAAAYDNNRGGKYMGKTFRSTGSPVMRFLYAQQKYMAYALEVTDKIFEGGTNAAVTESLNRLENANLTQEEIGQLADYTANRRTFKDATWTDADGKEHGSALSRKAQQIKRPLGAVGDVVMPYASVPMNVAQMGIDYTAGVAKSVTEIASIIQDARAGKEIDVVRQRQAASDFGRGLTGTGLICLFAAAAAKGVIGVHDDKDKDKKALEQSQGLSGAQINWSAMARALEGGSEEWQDGDVVSSLDFLEPFNTQLYLAYELSREDGFLEMLKAYPKASIASIASSLMDSPMMQGLNDLGELIGGVAAAAESGDIGEGMDAMAGYAGSVASSFIPQYVRQTAQYTDGYYRDTRGENTAEYAKNSFLAAIPGASNTLPKKVDGFGNEQERGGFINTFLDPTNTRRLALSDEAGYLSDLAEKTGNFGIYPDRQAPMRVKNADGQAVELTGQQREDYQKVYGQWAEGYYSSLMKNKDFRSLPEDMQAEALEKAKEYASGHARSAVTDYAGEKAGSYGSTASEIVRDVVLADMGRALNRAKGGKGTGALEDAYQNYHGLTATGRRELLEDADKSTKNYIAARESGVSDAVYVRVLEALDGTKNQGEKIQALKNVGGMTSQQKEDIIKANVSDKQAEVIDEVQEIAEKYDIPGDYLELYSEAYGIVTPKGKKNDKIRKLMDEYGINWSAAAALYGAYK